MLFFAEAQGFGEPEGIGDGFEQQAASMASGGWAEDNRCAAFGALASQVHAGAVEAAEFAGRGCAR